MRKGSTDGRSPLAMMSPVSTHGEQGPLGSGGSTPVQGAPQAPSMTPITLGKPSLQAIATVVNNVKAELHFTRLQQQDEFAPPSNLTALQKLRERKKALAKNELECSRRGVQSCFGLSQILHPPADSNYVSQIRDNTELEAFKTQADVMNNRIQNMEAQMKEMQDNQGQKLKEMLEKELKGIREEQQKAHEEWNGIRGTQLSIASKQHEKMPAADFSKDIKSLWDCSHRIDKSIGGLISRIHSLETLSDRIEVANDNLRGDLAKTDKHERETYKLATEARQKVDDFKEKSVGFERRITKLEADLDVKDHGVFDRLKKTEGLFHRMKDVEELKKKIDTFTAQITACQSTITKLQSTINELGPTVIDLGSRVATIESSKTEIRSPVPNIANEAQEAALAAVQNGQSNLERELSSIKQQLQSLNSADIKREAAKKSQAETLGEISRTMQSLTTRLSTLEKVAGERNIQVVEKGEEVEKTISGLEARINELGKSSDRNFEHITDEQHNLKTDLDGTRNLIVQQVADFMKTILNPHIATNNERLEGMDKQLSNHVAEIAQLKQCAASNAQLSACPRVIDQSPNFRTDLDSFGTQPQNQSNSVMNATRPFISMEDLNKLRGELQNLQQFVGQESDARQKAIQGLEQQLKNVQDITAHSIQSLEARYENIQTDQLYQQIVNEIQRMYPDAPAFLQQLGIVQNRVNSLINDSMSMQHILRDARQKGETAIAQTSRAETTTNQISESVARLQGSFADLEQSFLQLNQQVYPSEQLNTVQEHIAKLESKCSELQKVNEDIIRGHNTLQEVAVAIQRKQTDFDKTLTKCDEEGIGWKRAEEKLTKSFAALDEDVKKIQETLSSVESVSSRFQFAQHDLARVIVHIKDIESNIRAQFPKWKLKSLDFPFQGEEERRSEESPIRDQGQRRRRF
ncbi:hypothetical protein CC78DRAFT_345437 [Lojkania enalia]|uniref:Uncharacterized protein n=1 Tax=Lojkania enalia TaxID=147567 RepID=A0A9P4K4E3_9PLEO|nr:hypothetical protein CC78DRAFT_345437 [Didymosphaeria enalia]